MIEKSRANEDTLGLCSVDFKKSKQFWKKVQLLGLTVEYKSNNQKLKRLILKMTSVGFTLQHLYINLAFFNKRLHTYLKVTGLMDN